MQHRLNALWQESFTSHNTYIKLNSNEEGQIDIDQNTDRSEIVVTILRRQTTTDMQSAMSEDLSFRTTDDQTENSTVKHRPITRLNAFTSFSTNGRIKLVVISLYYSNKLFQTFPTSSQLRSHTSQGRKLKKIYFMNCNN